VVGTFAMLNLFIAVVCSAMEQDVQPVPAPRTAAHDDLLLRQVA